MPTVGPTQVANNATPNLTKPIDKFVAIPSFPACLNGQWQVLSTEPFLRALMQFTNNATMPPHHYPKASRITVLSGGVLVEDTTANCACLINAGQSYLVPARHVHNVQFLADTLFEFAIDSQELTVYWDLEER